MMMMMITASIAVVCFDVYDRDGYRNDGDVIVDTFFAALLLVIRSLPLASIVSTLRRVEFIMKFLCITA